MRDSRISASIAPAPPVFPPGAGFLGVLMLDTRFPRLVGDIGNPASFDVPVVTRVIRGARPEHAVQGAAAQRAAGLAEPFLAALHELEGEGAAAITTSCGFLVLMQARLQAAASVPVVTSSLLLLPSLLKQRAHVGVLTISAQNLDEEFLAAAGVPAHRMGDVAIEGVDPRGEFARAILGNQATLDVERAVRDVVEAALRLKAREPALTDLVLECTNMPPYAAAIERATGCRTWSLLQSSVLLAPWKQGGERM
jgi:hypothetical protein